ncbi:MAG: helix-turn-helix transcriptional regulator [Verrucomicrobia bacterium]|nr:helix-turn-helix transcriptional regulator [Verrucomicrobiota bacterium]
MTGAHLIRLFRQHLGTTPMQSVWKRRVEAGAQLLRETGLAISEVAYQCGFQSPFHFSRMLRKHFGHPPRAYRRKMWGIDEGHGPRPKDVASP